MSINSASGLTSEEARVRLSAVGPNALPNEAEKSLFQIALSVAREPMLLLLIAAGAVSFLLAELVDALLLMGTVFIVLGISIYQEKRTERALHAEFVIATMENSLPALIGMLVVGGIVATIGIRASSSKEA